jgi:hypothetical protein
MTKNQKELREFLQLMARCHAGNGPKPKGWRYHGPADLLVREGQFFQPGERATKWKRSEAHACFRNAAMYAMEHGLRYVEGYASGIIPVHHGWCVDRGGNVVEVTWGEMGSLYYGIEFKPMLVCNGAVLFNEENVSIYKNFAPGQKSEKKSLRMQPKAAQQNA